MVQAMVLFDFKVSAFIRRRGQVGVWKVGLVRSFSFAFVVFVFVWLLGKFSFQKKYLSNRLLFG